MEQASYWMWPKRKLNGSSHVHATISSYNDSWEEQAFAEDSAGDQGGCMWPPTSYSCSFCGREFKSAQALGGHMNVHRRDRAKLKESSNHSQNPSTPIVMKYPSPLSPSGVSGPSTQDNCSELTWVSPSSSVIQEQPKVSLYSPCHSLSVQALNTLERENLRIGEMGCCNPKEFVKPNMGLSSLDSIMCGSQMSDTGGEEEGAISIKRQKKGSEMGERGRSCTLFPFFMKPMFGERHLLTSEVLGIGTSPMEELDLELRLGDRPKVK